MSFRRFRSSKPCLRSGPIKPGGINKCPTSLSSSGRERQIDRRRSSPANSPRMSRTCSITAKNPFRSKSIKSGQFVIGSFFASDNTCPACEIGYQSSCQHRELVGGAQAPLLRVPLADGTLVATPGVPPDDLVPSLLTTSDVLGTGWFAADAANVKPGSTVAVVGDSAVGLLGILSARQMGAARIIAMSRHEARHRAIALP